MRWLEDVISMVPNVWGTPSAATPATPASAPASASGSAPAPVASTGGQPAEAAAVLGHWAEGDRARLDGAMAVVNENLGGTLWTSDAEARRALAALNELPEALRAEALGKLDSTRFEDLLDELPDEERAVAFRPLFESAGDPERKLRLWKELHLAQVASDVEAGERTVDRLEDPAERKEEERWQERREKTASETRRELDDEVKVLEEMRKAGTLTADEVTRLAERKELEHRLEMTFNMGISAEGTRRLDGTRVIWSTDELRDVERTLGALPEAHVAGNHELEGMRRAEKVPGNPYVGGAYDHGSRVLSFYDKGKDNPTQSITHEIGHSVQEKLPDRYGDFVTRAGWEGLRPEDLEAAGVRPSDVVKLGQHDPPIDKDGKQYMRNRYQNTGQNPYWALDGRALPAIPAPDGVRTYSQRDPWWYARSDPQDHFAELYQLSVREPDLVYRDLVQRPAEEAAAATGPAAQRALDSRDQRQQLRDLMRNDILGTDVAVTAAAERLRQRGVSEEQLAHFLGRAERAGAPHQIDALEEELLLSREINPNTDEGAR